MDNALAHFLVGRSSLSTVLVVGKEVLVLLSGALGYVKVFVEQLELGTKVSHALHAAVYQSRASVNEAVVSKYLREVAVHARRDLFMLLATKRGEHACLAVGVGIGDAQLGQCLFA